MTSRFRDGPAATGVAVGGSMSQVATLLAVLGVSRVLAHRAPGARWHVPANLATAGAVLTLVAHAEVDATALGLGREHVADGLRLGLAGSAAVTTGLCIVATVEPGLVRDRRAEGLSSAQVWREVAWRIPAGTVLLEELAFRGVLPALLARPGRPDWWPGLAASVLFGCWHVCSAADLVENNPAAASTVDRVGTVAGVALHVGMLAVVGGVLDRLRRRSHSLLAPALVHLTANALGVVAARVAGRQGA